MEKLLYVIIALLATFRCGFGSGIAIDISPNRIDEKLKGAPVKISCTPTPDMDNIVDVLLAIELFRNGKLLIKMISGQELKVAAGMEHKFEAFGHIDARASQSYLRATLLNPQREDAGEYECSMFYMDNLGSSKEEAAQAKLSYGHIDPSTFADRLAVVENQMKTITTQFELRQSLEKDWPVFSARCSKVVSIEPGSTIIFDDVVVSEGNAYDASTGLFTATRPGIYNFGLSVAMGKTGGFLNVDIHVNDTKQAGLTTADKEFEDQSAVQI